VNNLAVFINTLWSLNCIQVIGCATNAILRSLGKEAGIVVIAILIYVRLVWVW
jgi:hypothetical protein